MVDRQEIEKLVRAKLTAHLSKAQNSQLSEVQRPQQSPLDFVNEKYIESLPEGTKMIPIKAGAVITPSARDAAEMAGIEFQVIMGNIEISTPQNPKAIAIGSDHGGFAMKEVIKKKLQEWGHAFVDVGTHSEAAVDYPDIAHAVALLVARGECVSGIVIDGAGIGSAMVANKVPGIRAANCHNIFEVNNAKEHNNANVLSLGGRVIGDGLALEMVRTWLKIPFAGGRHQRRVDKIMAVEQTYFRG